MNYGYLFSDSGGLHLPTYPAITTRARSGARARQIACDPDQIRSDPGERKAFCAPDPYKRRKHGTKAEQSWGLQSLALQRLVRHGNARNGSRLAS